MVLFAADYPFLDVLWTMIIFFCWVVWIWMMIAILSDVFRRRDMSGCDRSRSTVAARIATGGFISCTPRTSSACA